MAKGLKKRTQYRLVKAGYIASIGMMLYGFIAGTIGLNGAVNTAPNKIDKYAEEFKKTPTFIENFYEQKAECDRALAAEEITPAMYNEKLAYYDSTEYAAEMLKASEDPGYTAVLKTKDVYANLGYSAIAPLALGGISFAVGTAFIIVDETLKHLKEAAKEEVLAEKEEKEKKKLEDIGKGDEEEFKRAEF